MKANYSQKIEEARQKQDKIRFERAQLNSQLLWYNTQNKMMYFYPVKVNTTKEDLAQKNAELELYQQIINRTFAFIQDRIDENNQKQTLVEELNKYVGDSVQEILDDEKTFYQSDNKDKLKVPPFTKVRRIPRDYTNEQKI